MKTPRRAFTMTEMLAVLGIMPIFMLIATQLYRGIMITADTSQRQIAGHATFDAATAQMWRDIFSATDVQSDKADTILIIEHNGQQIRWRSDQSNLLRIAGDRRTFIAPRDLSLKIDLQTRAIVLQLRGPQGCEDQATCTMPALFWRPP
jgi:prepilin-type N-terminal cleavage/methylation domain-containing protein